MRRPRGRRERRPDRPARQDPADRAGTGADVHLLHHRHAAAVHGAADPQHARHRRSSGPSFTPNLYVYSLAFAEPPVRLRGGDRSFEHRHRHGRPAACRSSASPPRPRCIARRHRAARVHAGRRGRRRRRRRIATNPTRPFQTFGFWFDKDFRLLENLSDLFPATTRVRGLDAQHAHYATLASVERPSPPGPGYAFAVDRFRGRGVLFAIALADRRSCWRRRSAVPLYFMISQSGLSNTLLAIILPALVYPFGAFLMRIFAEAAIPLELLDAARVDGAGADAHLRHRLAVSARARAGDGAAVRVRGRLGQLLPARWPAR